MGRLPNVFNDNNLAILMLHRFERPDMLASDHCGTALRSNLEYLHRNKIRMISFEDLIEDAESCFGVDSRGVVFTVDDGYGDFYEVALPIFAEFDCPVTVFLTTGFVSGDLWLWWDQVEFVLSEPEHAELNIDAGTQRVARSLVTNEDRRRAVTDVVRLLKLIPDQSKKELIRALADQLEVAIPARPPRQYAPMSWDQVRSCGDRGVTFGPHTVSHPILSKADDKHARAEICESWRRVRDETARAIPVFCYPNGDPDSYYTRDIDILKNEGIRAAVTSQPGYATLSSFQGDSVFTLPRYSHTHEPIDFIQQVTGFEAVKDAVRQRFSFSSQASRK